MNVSWINRVKFDVLLLKKETRRFGEKNRPSFTKKLSLFHVLEKPPRRHNDNNFSLLEDRE